jgi:hypothetical protein
LEREVVAGTVEGFHDDTLRIPALTLFALEEPENHLSPYFLARIIRQVRSLTDVGGAQAIVTSHSPAVLSRGRKQGRKQGQTLRYPHKFDPVLSLGEQRIMVTRDPLLRRPDGID